MVTIVTGSFDTGRMAASTALRVEGSTSTIIPADLDFSGRFRHVAFRVTAAECKRNQSLFVTLSSATSGHFYGDNSSPGMHTHAWLLNAVLITANASGTAPTATARRFLSLAEGLASTALENWMFVGPFDDPHFTAGARIVGPESGTAVDLNVSYADGFGGNASWSPLPAQRSDSVPLPVRMPPRAAACAINKTVAIFPCARFFVPLAPEASGGASATSTVKAQLTGSTSGLACFRVNGATAPPDRLITGRTLSEFSRTVTLRRGECNELLVKAQQLSWAAEWEMSLSLSVPGLRTC